jgi:hypothetical protein
MEFKVNNLYILCEVVVHDVLLKFSAQFLCMCMLGDSADRHENLFVYLYLNMHISVYICISKTV